MRRRRGRPGLMGTMARTAVVAGTATAVHGKVSGKQQQAAAAQQQQAAAAQQEELAQQQKLDTMASELEQLKAKEAAAPKQDDLMGQLQKLADMKTQGLLSDDEFAAMKAKLLA